MKAVSRSWAGDCIVLRGAFGSQIRRDIRVRLLAHIQAVERLRAQYATRYPPCVTHFDAYIARARACAAGAADISLESLRSELANIRVR